MIQINLLPDVKQEYLRARRTRNLAISSSIIAGLVAGGVVVVLALGLAAQTAREIIVDNRIEDEYETLSSTENLSELVTLQNQLDLISSQHENKSVDSRLFSMLQAINPAAPDDVQFSSIRLSSNDASLVFEGVTDGGYAAVEALTKTIMNTKIEYLSGEEAVSEPIATKVSIISTGFGEDTSGQRVLRFEVSVDYHEQLFVNTAKEVEIVGPTKRIDVTDSRIGVPDSLFAAPVQDEEESE